MDQAESLRNIIKKQEIDEKKRTARVITVTSGKGGVGKTSFSVNLAIQLHRLGKRVVVLDADFGLANIEIMLGIRPKYNLADLMFRGKSIQDVMTYGPEGIGFLSGGSGINEMANLNREQVFWLIQKMEELDKQADVIIVDTGAGIGDSVLEFVAASEEVLLVATPEPTSITDAYALLKALNRNSSYMPEKTVVKMIANQVRGKKEADEFLDIDIDYLGAIPYDVNMQRAVMHQKPLSVADPDALASQSVEKIALSLLDMEKEKPRTVGIKQLFSNVIRMKFNRR